MMRKPKVVILGTGGTIAGKAGSNTEMTGYQAGEIGIQTLINAVPEMLEVADVTGEQFCNIGSFDMIDDIWLRLSRRVSELLQQPEVDGIVITHGTDTLEETAYGHYCYKDGDEREGKPLGCRNCQQQKIGRNTGENVA